MRDLLAEFTGTFFVCLAVVAGGDPVATGAAVAVAMFALAPVSGGHFNPAVSLAVWLRGRMDRRDLFRYWGAQFAGGLAACLAAGVAGAAASGTPVWPLIRLEVVFTFLLALVVLQGTTTDRAGREELSGLAAGLAVLAGAGLARSTPVAAFNPAAAVALVVAGAVPASMLPAYLAACAAGGALAAVAFRLLNPDD